MSRHGRDTVPGLLPPEKVLRYGSVAAAGLGSVIFVLVSQSLKDHGITTEEGARRKAELRRRAERLSETMRAVQSTEDEDVSGDVVGQVKHETVLQRCRELESFSHKLDDSTPERQLLMQGFEWAGKLLRKELRVAVRLTSEGLDLQYSDGGTLNKLLDERVPSFHRVSTRARCAISSDLRNDLQLQVSRGEHVRRRRALVSFGKASRLLLRVRATLPWVLTNIVLSVFSGALATVATDYQYMILESFLRSRINRRRFGSVAAAWMAVELVCTLLHVLQGQISARGEKVASRVLAVQLFRAVARQELVWFEKKTEHDLDELSRLVHREMPSEVKKVMNVPRVLIYRFSCMVTAAWRLREQGSRVLCFLVAASWARRPVQVVTRWITDSAFQRVYSGMLMPSLDDQTFRYALRAEYTMLYQSFARGNAEARKFELSAQNMLDFEARWNTVREIIEPIEKVLGQGLTVCQFATVGDLVQQRMVSEGQARGLTFHAGEITRHIQGTYNEWFNVQANCAVLAKAYDIITIPPKIDPDAGIVPSGKAAGHLVFKGVKFHYPERQVVVLDGMCIEVKPGQAAALVGRTGCGKTTVFKLLHRFYDATEGTIFLDGRDIREYNPEWVREQIVAVSQEPELIPLTIRDNVTFGCRHDPSLAEIEEACRAANIWEDLQNKSRFPEGLQTKLRVVKNLSGGEKQRICIARAVLANPSILLLDEATSALDKTTENVVQQALENLMQGRTTLVIAHRLFTIRSCDRIFCMRDGKVVEEGTHDDLILKPTNEEGSVYANLWREQLGATPEIASPHSRENVGLTSDTTLMTQVSDAGTDVKSA